MKNFDKNIRKKLYNAEMPVADGLWTAIEKQIPTKKDRPKLWLLYMIAALAIPIAIIQFSGSSTDNEDSQVEALDRDYPSASLYEKGWQHDSSERSESTDRSAVSSSGQYSSHNTQSASPEDINHKNTSGQNNNSAVADLLNKHNKTTKTLADLETRDEKKLVMLNNPFSDSNLKSVSSGGTSAFKLIEKSRVLRSSEKIKPFANLPGILSAQVSASQSQHELLGDSESYSAAICPRFEKLSSGLYIYGEVRPSFSRQSLSSSASEVPAQLGDRQKLESGYWSSYAAIGLGRQWKSGVMVETGISYDQINARFRLSEEDEIVRSVRIITSDTVNTPSGPIITNDTSYQQIVEETEKVTNKFRQFNIPVQLGYQFHLRDRFSMIARGGILINVSSTNEGKLFNDEGMPEFYSSDRDTPTYFKTNVGVAYLAGLDLVADIGRNTSAYAGINMSYYPSSFSLSTNPISQTYMKYGLTMGVRYRL